MKKYIIYHDKCTDGFGAAWVAWKVFQENAKYIPLSHYDEIPTFEKNSEIFLLDFCFESKVLERLASDHKITVLDHHISAFNDIKHLIDTTSIKFVFDLKKSGAELAWNYWFKDQPLPALIEYIKDRDLGLFALPDTELIISALMCIEKDFNIWTNLSIENLKQQGIILKEAQMILMKEMMEKVHFAEIGGDIVPVVNSTVWWSDITKELIKSFPEFSFVAAYYALDDKRIKWSLRSAKSHVDVSIISQQYGGGGHCCSGGFTAERNQIKFISYNDLSIKKAS